jgi:hypothetical protein
MNNTLDLKFNREQKQMFLRVIKDAVDNKPLSESDFVILFYWVRHQNDPAFNFVPKKYRTVGGPNLWDTKKI